MEFQYGIPVVARLFNFIFVRPLQTLCICCTEEFANLTVDFPPKSILAYLCNDVPGLACLYMSSWRVLNSIALIKGSSLSEVSIKREKNTWKRPGLQYNR
jgi:hypothetical protein